MLQFKLFNEDEYYKEYTISLNYEDTEEFWLDLEDSDFAEFMDKMETGK